MQNFFLIQLKVDNKIFDAADLDTFIEKATLHIEKIYIKIADITKMLYFWAVIRASQDEMVRNRKKSY